MTFDHISHRSRIDHFIILINSNDSLEKPFLAREETAGSMGEWQLLRLTLQKKVECVGHRKPALHVWQEKLASVMLLLPLR